MMSDEDAIEGLKQLGLTTYEARVFLALQKLGSGSASEISEVADVPRSQVYGAAENLEKRELVEIQQSTPTVYRPVPLEEARTRLLDRLAETGSETFDYLDSVHATESETERSQAIWLVRGANAVTSRVSELAEVADERVLYAVSDPSLLDERVLEVLEDKRDRGLDVLVASASQAVREAAREAGFDTHAIPSERDPDVSTARVLLADDGTMLLSVFSSTEIAEGTEEVAFWSADTAFAAVLFAFLEEWFDDPFGQGCE
ncbi:MAG: sugar-specific transcriptional regulator TrmB [Haloarculaceae archaeon]|jgi:sugar-specific transcriptional regulator TrmB